MGRRLIVVESPAKIKTIAKFLGPGYVLEASLGHVRDLPPDALGVDVDGGFEPQYVVIEGKEKVVRALQEAADGAETVYLAPDPDREGEAIAWHVGHLLEGHCDDVRRIQFNEITRRAVLEALEHPRAVDRNLFEAQQARRILDRLVGYELSDLLRKKVVRGSSAGRVQSVALRLVVDREAERWAFEPEEYWVFRARAAAPRGGELVLELARIDGGKAKIACAEEAEALKRRVEGASFVVAGVERRRRESQPRPPFTTSTLQQAANQRLGYSSRRTMGIAQGLYEGVETGDGNVTALITYMRTDSVRVADEAREAAARFIGERFGSEYLPPERRDYKAKASAQDAHEAIRPVDVSLAPEDVKAFLEPEQHSLYRLIWSRFVASQMAAEVHEDTAVSVSCAGTEWQARGRRRLFDGWQRVLPEDRDALLPDLETGEGLEVGSVDGERKFTQPPGRYTEAGLVKAMEENGIGRPSTYAETISKILARGYVEKREKSLVPTVLGRAVCSEMVDSFQRLMDVRFTAGMEGDLDRIAEGEEGWRAVLEGFWKDFKPALDAAYVNMRSLKGGVATDIACPKCGRPLLVRFSPRNGAFLGCSGYAENVCKFTSDCAFDDRGALVMVKKEDQVAGTCPKCGNPLLVRRSRGGRFLGCSDYPVCDYSSPYATGVTCPKCGKGRIVEKSARSGRVFYSCDRYPACDFAMWNEPVPEACPDCGSPYLVVRKSAQGPVLACPSKDCGHTRPLGRE